jgi:hypothetical protein
VQLADLRMQRRHVAALGQLDGLDVVVEIRLRVDPHRVGEVERHPGQLLPQRRRERQARREVAPQVVHEAAAVAGRQLEHVQAADMHRHLGGLHEQKLASSPESCFMR